MTPQSLDIIATDSERTDVGVLCGCKLEVSYGADENDFELTCPEGTRIDDGAYVYIEGTEWGGVVDGSNPCSTEDCVKYTGRSWHGILAGKILCPPAGESHLEVSGDANDVLDELVSICGLESVFVTPGWKSGIAIEYEFERFVDAWSGIVRMLAEHGAAPDLAFNGEHVVIQASPITDYADESWDTDRADVDLKKTALHVNHLVCVGVGEGADRTVVHLYADSSGNVSRTQSLFGIDEITQLYDFSNADEDQLAADGTERLKDLQEADTCSVTVNHGDYRINDIVGANDASTGEFVMVPITQIIVTVSNGCASISYGAGTGVSSSGGVYSGSGGGGGGFVSYKPGDGITIVGRTINADVTPETLATTAAAGLVKPDGTTVTVDADGTIHAVNGDVASIIARMVEDCFAGIDFVIDENGHLNYVPPSDVPANEVVAMIREEVDARIALMEFDIVNGNLIWDNGGA